jgi:hypothetical protein
MFDDHLIFSNNIIDAANQLRNIQLQKLEEEKYKQRSIKLQEQVNELENIIHLIESGQSLTESDWWRFLGRLSREERIAGEEAVDVLAKLRKTWIELHPDKWTNILKEMRELGFIGKPLTWTHPVRGSEIWILKGDGTGIYIPYRWNGEKWIGVTHGRTPWGTTVGTRGTVISPKGKGEPNPNGDWFPEQVTASTATGGGVFDRDGEEDDTVIL